MEISGNHWKDRCQFKEYKNLYYSDYDICAGALGERFDLIIAEQVFEHLLWLALPGREACPRDASVMEIESVGTRPWSRSAT